MAPLDWSQCPAVESVPGRLGGAWVFRDTRMLVPTVFENLEATMHEEFRKHHRRRLSEEATPRAA